MIFTRHIPTLFIATMIATSFQLNSQDLDSLLNAEMATSEKMKVTIFRSTSIANGHSVTMLPPGTLDFRIEHRFGAINGGAYELWGLDNASIHFSFEYGITDWLIAGIGRGTYEKTFDSFLRFKPLSQKSDGAPVSIAWQSSVYLNTLRFLADFEGYEFSQRFEQVHQVMIARQFGDRVSVQLTPSYLKRVPVPAFPEQINLFALGSGVGVKITPGFSINAEYFYLLNMDNSMNPTPIYNPLSFSFDLETGGHIFQLIFTNSRAMTEHGIIGNTTGNWMDGDIYFGFNISRAFDLN